MDLPSSWKSDWLLWSVSLVSTSSDGLEDKESLPYISSDLISPWTGKLVADAPRNVISGGHLFRHNDVLFNRLRPYLAKVYLAEFDGVSSSHILNLRVRHNLRPLFLFYVLSSSAFINTVNAEAFGTKMPLVDWEIVGHQPLPLPNLDLQDRIIEYLNKKINVIDRLIEKQSTLRMRITENWNTLVYYAVTQGCDTDYPMKRCNHSWFKSIPKHWDCWPLRRYIEAIDYGTSSKTLTAGRIAILRMTNIQDQDIDYCDLKYLDSVKPALLLKKNDLLFNRTNSIDLVGKSAVYKDDFSGRVSFASYLARFRFDERYLPEYAGYVLGTEQLLAYARTLALRSIGQVNLNPSRFARVFVPVPPVEEQKRIIDFLGPHRDKCKKVRMALSTSIDKLTEYRAALICAAVTGNIDYDT